MTEIIKVKFDWEEVVNDARSTLTKSYARIVGMRG